MKQAFVAGCGDADLLLDCLLCSVGIKNVNIMTWLMAVCCDSLFPKLNQSQIFTFYFLYAKSDWPSLHAQWLSG